MPLLTRFMLLLLFFEMVNVDADQVADVTLLPILFGYLLLVHNGWVFLGQPCLPMMWRLSFDHSPVLRWSLAFG